MGASFDDLGEHLHVVIRDLQSAITFYEAARVAYLDSELLERFNGTQAGRTFHTLRTAALFQAALTTIRMWDRGRDVCSLVSIARELGDDSTLTMFADRARESQTHLWGPCVGDRVRAGLIATRDKINQADQSRLSGPLERLRAYRNKRLAHRDTSSGTMVEKARQARISDVAILLAASRQMVRRLRLDMLGTRDSPRNLQMIKRREAEAFWALAGQSGPEADDDTSSW